MKVFRRRGLLVLIVFFLLAGVSCQNRSESGINNHFNEKYFSEEHYNKGVEYASEGKFIEAGGEFKKSLKIDSGNSASKDSLEIIRKANNLEVEKERVVYFFKIVHYLVGVGYASEGKFIQAHEEFKKALKLNPDNDDATFSLEITDDAIDLKVKKKAATHIFMGVAADDKRMWDRAVTEYARAIKIDPNYEKAYNKRGSAYYNNAQYDLAIADYTKAIELYPQYTFAYYNRGIAYKEKGRYDRAIADYTRAIDIDPEFPAAYNNRGLAYDDKGQYDLAIADYTKAIELYPEFAFAYSNRGNAYKKKDRYDLAFADYTKAIEIDPNSASTYYNRGNGYKKKGRYDLAINDYKKAVEIDPKLEKAYYMLGKVYTVKGRYDLAIADYTKAVEIDPKDADAYNNRGFVYYEKLNEKTKACRDWKRACGLGVCRNYNYARGRGECG